MRFISIYATMSECVEKHKMKHWRRFELLGAFGGLLNGCAWHERKHWVLQGFRRSSMFLHLFIDYVGAKRLENLSWAVQQS